MSADNSKAWLTKDELREALTGVCPRRPGGGLPWIIAPVLAEALTEKVVKASKAKAKRLKKEERARQREHELPLRIFISREYEPAPRKHQCDFCACDETIVLPTGLCARSRCVVVNDELPLPDGTNWDCGGGPGPRTVLKEIK